MREFIGFIDTLVSVGGLEFIVVKDSKKNWTEARSDCELRGCSLTSILNLQEANVLKDYS